MYQVHLVLPDAGKRSKTMVALPTYNSGHLKSLLKIDVRLPFYCVMLYAPINGLDERMHEYVVSHWEYLDGLTGRNCQLVVLEQPFAPPLPIGEFRPEEVYEIARYL